MLRKVIAEDQVLRFFEKLGLLSEVEAWRRELEEELNGDPKTVFKLLKEPIIYEYEGEEGKVKFRRYRLYLKGFQFRSLFVINVRECLVDFVLIEKRDEETYKRFKRKLD